MVLGKEALSSCLQAEDFNAVVRAFGLRRPIVVAWYERFQAIFNLCGNLIVQSRDAGEWVVRRSRPQSRTPLMQCGPTATAVADLYTSALPSANPISGLVLVAPLLFLDTHPGAEAAEMPRMATARMLSVADALCASSQDAVMSARAKTELVQGVFAGAARRVPDALRSSWLGQSIAQPAEVTACVLAQRHDPTRLLEAGRQGLPLMVLVGEHDALVDSSAAVSMLRRHFRNMEAHAVGAGCHAIFLDQKDEFVKLLLVFVGRLAVRASLSF